MAENLLRLKNLLRAYALRSRSHLDLPPPRIAGTNMAQAMQPASGDEIDRARPGLIAVRLRHAHIDRKVGAARERHDVIDGEAPAPVLLGQTIDADAPPEAAAVEGDRVVGQRREIDLAGDDAGLELERAAPRRLQPKIDAGQVARGHRSPSQRGAG